ncbi:MAG: hypothetical protein Q7J06_04450 [Bacteroidales bacterium]|nr:hypothetical protein [Bacteroidales bacterium]
MSEPIEICNLADHNTKLELMKVAIETLSKNPDMGIVVALLICTFMQSLADTSNSLFYKYFERHFPELDKSIGFMMFYKHLRNKAVHEFAIKPPLGLAHSQFFDNENDYKKEEEIDGQKWTFLNVYRLTKDFLEHLDSLKN